MKTIADCGLRIADLCPLPPWLIQWFKVSEKSEQPSPITSNQLAVLKRAIRHDNPYFGTPKPSVRYVKKTTFSLRQAGLLTAEGLPTQAGLLLVERVMCL